MDWDKIPNDGRAYFELMDRKAKKELTAAREKRNAQSEKRRKLIQSITRRVTPTGVATRLEQYWGHKPQDLLELRAFEFSMADKAVQKWMGGDSREGRAKVKAEIQEKLNALYKPHGKHPQLKVFQLYPSHQGRTRRWNVYIEFRGGGGCATACRRNSVPSAAPTRKPSSIGICTAPATST